jgi:hypothetical protein
VRRSVYTGGAVAGAETVTTAGTAGVIVIVSMATGDEARAAIMTDGGVGGAKGAAKCATGSSHEVSFVSALK